MRKQCIKEGVSVSQYMRGIVDFYFNEKNITID